MSFIEDAVKTESPTTPELIDRLLNNDGLIYYLSELTVINSENLDNYKKHVYYGKSSLEEPSRFYLNTDEQTRLANTVRLLHGIVGINGEGGELFTLWARHVFDGEELDKTNLKEEIGDIFWYLALICHECGWTFEEVQEMVIAKLKLRYGDKFSEDKALNRDLEAERKVLENHNISY